MSSFGLSKQLNIRRDLAQKYIDTYFARYPGVQTYMERTREQARQHGYVETLWGRRLYLPLINAKNKQQQMAAERAAINGPLQGSSADLIKRAMIQLNQTLMQENHDAYLVMQVHDELVLEVRAEQVDAMKILVENTLVNAAELRVPLKVSVGVGPHWDAAHQ